jgi:hypothetical protein
VQPKPIDNVAVDNFCSLREELMPGLTKTRKICPKCHGTGYLHDYKDLGLRMRREKAGLTIKAAATQMGVSEGYLSDMERGARPWTPDLMTKFFDAIG